MSTPSASEVEEIREAVAALQDEISEVRLPMSVRDVEEIQTAISSLKSDLDWIELETLQKMCALSETIVTNLREAKELQNELNST